MSKSDKKDSAADQAPTVQQEGQQPGTTDPAPAAPAAPAKESLEKGQEVILTAAHGLLVHPFLKPEVRFDQGTLTKVTVDSWVIGQYAAGKLHRS